MKNRLIELLSDESLSLDSAVSPGTAAEQILLYLAEWKRWNAKISLTAETDAESVIDKHIYDSLQYSRAISPNGTLADIGSGAGFPAIPVKVIFPKLEMILIESQRKRANFLKTTLRSMGLDKICCVHGRVEDFPDLLGCYDFVTLRHVQELNLSLQLGAGLLKNGGKLVLQIGPEATFQANQSPAPILLSLIDRIPIKRLSGSASKLMVFERQSD
ncbi:MAG: 16S rRNA (guanine(527)-N(7))-methyltransferase RsmG [Nitrospinaceae bacterium]|jgi:16S rRNA (guanine527-N7)-methyltransferase|nr:16S rRNA (guanine(527)-N(7))-methyltransferase RsmG [Nitrospinaceae bacterium]|tara:strand:- start:2415 stop:3062 length:648 start_codon:yes stop_codon:yes gene_type:complete